MSAETPAAKFAAAASAEFILVLSSLKASLREFRKLFPGAAPPLVPSTAPVPLAVLAPLSGETEPMPEGPEIDEIEEMPEMPEMAPMAFMDYAFPRSIA